MTSTAAAARNRRFDLELWRSCFKVKSGTSLSLLRRELRLHPSRFRSPNLLQPHTTLNTSSGASLAASRLPLLRCPRTKFDNGIRLCHTRLELCTWLAMLNLPVKLPSLSNCNLSRCVEDDLLSPRVPHSDRRVLCVTSNIQADSWNGRAVAVFPICGLKTSTSYASHSNVLALCSARVCLCSSSSQAALLQQHGMSSHDTANHSAAGESVYSTKLSLSPGRCRTLIIRMLIMLRSSLR